MAFRLSNTYLGRISSNHYTLCGTSSAGALALTPHEELFALAEKLKKAAGGANNEGVAKPIGALEDAAKEIGR